MKIENLEVGQVIKNYEELTKVLEIDFKSSNNTNGRKSQKEELARYVKYHNEGQKFIIDEIYKEPKEIEKKPDGRANNKGGGNRVYCDDIKVILLSLLAKYEELESISISSNNLLKWLDMINENYKVGRASILKLSEMLEVPKEFIYEFYHNSNIELKRKLESALKTMRNERLIDWCRSMNVQKKVLDVNVNALQELVIEGEHYEHREATDKEKQLILKIEKEVLKDMNIKNAQIAYIQGRWNEFKKEVENRLKEQETYIEYYYSTYKIIYNYEHIIEELNGIEAQGVDIMNTRKVLNKKVVKGLKTGHTKKHNNAKAKINEYTLFDLYQENIDTRAKDNYVEYSNKLVDNLIDREAKDITNELKYKSVDKEKLVKVESKSKMSIEEINDNIAPW